LSVLIIIKAVPDYIEKKEDVVRVHLCDGYEHWDSICL